MLDKGLEGKPVLPHLFSRLFRLKTASFARAARLSVCQLEDRLTPSMLIPVVNHHDLVFDSVRNLLYITTDDGKVQRYDVANGTLLSPLAVGTTLNGADITPDGKSLY